MEKIVFVFLSAIVVLAFVIGRRMWMVKKSDAMRPSIFTIDTIAHIGRNLFSWIPAILKITLTNIITGIRHILHVLLVRIDRIAHRH